MKLHHRLQPLKSFIEIKKTERLWHFPLLAGLCVGICLFLGWYLKKPEFGNLSSMGALTILYFTHSSLSKRMIHLVVCAFGFVFSFTFGLLFSFNPMVSAVSVGFIGFFAHLITSYYDVPPPRNFFFIMLAAVASSIPFDAETLPLKVGLVGMGAMLAVFLAFFYSLLIAKKVVQIEPRRMVRKIRYTKIVESFIIGFTMFFSLTVAHFFKLDTPYWIPVSALAILQGKNFIHTRQRNFHRIVGTLIGIGLTWLILLLHIQGLQLVFAIAFLQIVIEMLVVRNYGLAAIFITPMTILLAESSRGVNFDMNVLMEARLIDTVIGSLIGFAAGWILHHENIIAKLEKRLRRTKIYIQKKN